MGPTEISLLLLFLLVFGGSWFVYQMFVQQGRILLRLEALEERLGIQTDRGTGNLPGLQPGSVVHDFELPDLRGNNCRMSQWSGRRMLLIFFDPRCGHCRRMLPQLAELPADPPPGKPLTVLISTGSREENHRLAEENHLHLPVLLQEDSEVASLYSIQGTPMGYLVDEQGVTVGERAVGAEQLMALARGESPAVQTSVATTGRFSRNLEQSRLLRTGLTAGSPAPGFTLPRLDGGSLSLGAYRGRRVLLVFSDPNCPPCDELAPELESHYRRNPDTQLILISRGDAEANRRKRVELGLTFPVVLQRHWEISRDYGMFATPIAYLVDEDGRLAAGVAQGKDQILNLLGQAGGSRKEARAAGAGTA